MVDIVTYYAPSIYIATFTGNAKYVADSLIKAMLTKSIIFMTITQNNSVAHDFSI